MEKQKHLFANLLKANLQVLFFQLQEIYEPKKTTIKTQRKK
jgi:hypothetical protein